MNKTDFQTLVHLGELAKEIRNKILKITTPGRKISVLCDIAHKLIYESGEKIVPAFPLNVSVNEIAAHDTAAINDSRVIPSQGVVKIDIGISRDGLIIDTARTKVLGKKHEYQKLRRAAEDALNAAIEVVKPGVKIGEVAKTIQNRIESYGFRPVENLSGHLIEPYILHAGVSFPNVSKPLWHLHLRKKIQKGWVIALEPFATMGKTGAVQDYQKPQIFSFQKKITFKTSLGKRLYAIYRTLPFSARMAAQNLKLGSNGYKKVTKTVLIEGGNQYHPLIDHNRKMVSQSEDTIIVTSNGAKILT